MVSSPGTTDEVDDATAAGPHAAPEVHWLFGYPALSASDDQTAEFCAQQWTSWLSLEPISARSDPPVVLQTLGSAWVNRCIATTGLGPLLFFAVVGFCCGAQWAEVFAAYVCGAITIPFMTNVHWSDLSLFWNLLGCANMYSSVIWMGCSQSHVLPIIRVGAVCANNIFTHMVRPNLHWNRMTMSIAIEFCILPLIIAMEALGMVPDSVGPDLSSGEYVFLSFSSVVYSLTVHRDVLGLRSAVQVLTESKANHELDRFRTLRGHTDTFVATLAHELRTPLSGIYNLLGCADEWMPDMSSEAQEWIGSAHDATRALLALLSSSLLYEQTVIGRMELKLATCDPAEVMSAHLQPLRKYASSKHVAIDFVSHWAGSARATLDVFKLNQVCQRLVDNAVKFTTRDGHVSICMWLGTAEDLARMSPAATEQYLQGSAQGSGHLFVTVSDGGPGVPHSAVERQVLFDRFVQADMTKSRRYDGVGLGLVCAKRLTEELGGRLGCYNSADRLGAVFWVGVPVSIEPASSSISHGDFRSRQWWEASVPTSSSRQSSATRSLNRTLLGTSFLCVSPDPDELVSLWALLRTWSSNVHVTTTIADAIALWDSSVVQPSFHAVFYSRLWSQQETTMLLKHVAGAAVAVVVERSPANDEVKSAAQDDSKLELRRLQDESTQLSLSHQPSTDEVRAILNQIRQKGLDDPNRQPTARKVLLDGSLPSDDVPYLIEAFSSKAALYYLLSVLALLPVVTRPTVVLPVTRFALACKTAFHLGVFATSLRWHNALLTLVFVMDVLVVLTSGAILSPFATSLCMWAVSSCAYSSWGPNRIARRAGIGVATLLSMCVVVHVIRWNALVFPVISGRAEWTLFSVCLHVHHAFTWAFSTAVCLRIVIDTGRNVGAGHRAKKDVKREYATVNRLLSVLSHEVRTPLHILNCSTEVLRKEAAEKGQGIPKELDAIVSAQQMLHRLVANSLQRDRVERSAITVVCNAFSPKELATRISALYSRRKRRVLVEVSGDISDRCWNGDQLLIFQIVTNLVANALWHGRGDVTICVSLSDPQERAHEPEGSPSSSFERQWPGYQQLNAPTESAQRQRRDRLVFHVSESKSTEPVEAKQHHSHTDAAAFETELAALCPSAGMGIGHCRDLARIMGGSLHTSGTSTRDGAGPAVAVLVLDLERAELRVVKQSDQTVQQQEKANGIEVLVAEDNELAQMALRSMLRRFGLSAVMAANGLEAVEQIRHRSFPLVLMDINMPVMDGVEATLLIKKSRPSVPVVAVTATIMDESSFAGVGFDDVVGKPLTLKRLRLLLETHRLLSGEQPQ